LKTSALPEFFTSFLLHFFYKIIFISTDSSLFKIDADWCMDYPPSADMAATSNKIDADWCTDTGATDHITSDLDHLAVRERYHGNEQLHVGNGSGLRITHIGHSSFNTATRPMVLRNILHVPEITKDLLSVHKFSRDNDVFF